MSRSYRYPVVGDNDGAGKKRYFKKKFNHRLRKLKDIPNYGAYKKLNPQWDICDYKYELEPDDKYYYQARRK